VLTQACRWGAGSSRGGGSNGGGGDRALEARVQELEQRLVQSEAERRSREAQHERDAQVRLYCESAVGGLECMAAHVQQAVRRRSALASRPLSRCWRAEGCLH